MENFKNSTIEEVYCDSKTSSYQTVLILTILFSIFASLFIMIIFYFELNLANAFCELLLVITPTIYFRLKIKNFNFYINNENVNYTNIIGQTFSYSLNEIIKSEIFYWTLVGIESSAHRSDYIIIKFIDKKKVKITSNDRNFELLKSFLSSKNILSVKNRI